MTLDALHEIGDRAWNREVRDGVILHREYDGLTASATVASHNAERGQLLPEDTDAEILRGWIGAEPGTTHRVLIVEALRTDLWSGVSHSDSGMRELLDSRRETESGWSLRITKRFEVDSSSYSRNLVPDKGEEYPNTWSEDLIATPRRDSVRVNHKFSVRKTLVEVDYISAAFSLSEFPLIGSTVSVETVRRATSRYEDLDGDLIQSKPDGSGIYYVPSGTGEFLLEYDSVVTVKTAMAVGDINWNTLWGLNNSVNEFVLPNLGNAPAKSMWMTGVGIPKYFLYSTDVVYVPIIFRMRYNPNLWDVFTTADRRRKWVKEEPVLHTDDDGDLDDIQYVKASDKTATTNVALAKKRLVLKDEVITSGLVRRVREYKDWSIVNALVTWV